MPAAAEEAGLGLGFFIAKTLLERSGAQVFMENSPPNGALVRVEWDRTDFERPHTLPRADPLSGA
jgi:two-component system sensor histidine kinase RegB